MHNSKYQFPMAACCTYHRPTYLLLATKQEPCKKAYLITKNIREFSGKSSGEWTSRQNKRQDRKSERTRQKNKRGENKLKSNDSREIPGRGDTTDNPGLPSRGLTLTQRQTARQLSR